MMIYRILPTGALLLLLAGCSSTVQIHLSEFRNMGEHKVMVKRLISLRDSHGKTVYDFSRSEMKTGWFNGRSAVSIKSDTYQATYACAPRDSVYWKKRGNCPSEDKCNAVDSEYRKSREIEIVSREKLIDRNGDYYLKDAVCSSMLDSPLELKGIKLD